MLNRQACRWLNVLFLLAVIALNILAEVLPLAGASTGELSERYFTMLTPAGYAFMIWSVIYVLLGGSVVYFFRRRDIERRFMSSFTIWFGLSCVFNISWLILWHHEHLILSFCAMVLLLISLLAIYRITRGILRPTPGETWFVRLPFSLYLGWVCTATLVNLQVVLQHSSLTPNLSSQTMVVTLIIIGVLAVILIGSRTRDGILPLPLAWGLIAIAVKHPEERTVIYTAAIGAAILLVLAISLLFIRSRDRD